MGRMKTFPSKKNLVQVITNKVSSFPKHLPEFVLYAVVKLGGKGIKCNLNIG